MGVLLYGIIYRRICHYVSRTDSLEINMFKKTSKRPIKLDLSVNKKKSLSNDKGLVVMLGMALVVVGILGAFSENKPDTNAKIFTITGRIVKIRVWRFLGFFPVRTVRIGPNARQQQKKQKQKKLAAP